MAEGRDQGGPGIAQHSLELTPEAPAPWLAKRHDTFQAEKFTMTHAAFE